VDLAVISLIESGAMESKDFIRTENYNLRLKPAGARKVVNEFSNLLNSKGFPTTSLRSFQKYNAGTIIPANVAQIVTDNSFIEFIFTRLIIE
jgi:CRISPR-associated protein Cas1